MASKKRKVAFYIRVSTTEQKIDGYSLEAQKKKLYDHIENNSSLEIRKEDVIVFCDVHTGSDFNRIELQKMLDLIKEGKIETVVVWKIDRLSRSLKHLLNIFEKLKENKCSLLSLQENIDFRGAIGSLIFQIFGAIAQFERELIRDRTKMGKLASAELGNWTSKAVGYGYKKVKNKSGKGSRLEVVRKEAEWVRKIFSWNTYENLGTLAISKKLNDLKVPRGEAYTGKDKMKPWTEKDVRRILEYRVYTGEYIANKHNDKDEVLPQEQWTIVLIPQIISELAFMQAQDARKQRTGGRRTTDYLLSGKLVDMTLESPKKFSGCKRTKGGFSYRRKQFKDRDGVHYPVFEVPGEAVDDFVWERIMEAMKRPKKFIQNYLARENIDQMGKVDELEREKGIIKQDIANIEYLKIPRVESAYENGTYSEETTSKKLGEYEVQLNKLRERSEEVDLQLKMYSSLNMEAEKLKEASEQVKYKVEHMTREQKKILCGLFVNRVEMYRHKGDDGKWIVQMKVVFNFNPKQYGGDDEEGRTNKPQEINKKDSEESNIVSTGAERRIGTTDTRIFSPLLYPGATPAKGNL